MNKEKLKIFDFFPEYAAQDTGLKASLRIKDLLTMTDGLTWNEVDYTRTGNSEHLMDSSADPVGYVLSLPMSFAPGKVFNYNSGATQVAGAIVEKATGKTIDEFARQYLFAPLGITNFQWGTNSNVTEASSGLLMRPRDMMKFGLLYMNDGKWNSKQIVPANWVKESTTTQINTHDKYSDDYGFFWWLFKDTILNKSISNAVALGDGGQRIFIDKANKLTVIFTEGNYRQYNAYSYEILTKFIYPALFKNE